MFPPHFEEEIARCSPRIQFADGGLRFIGLDMTPFIGGVDGIERAGTISFILENSVAFDEENMKKIFQPPVNVSTTTPLDAYDPNTLIRFQIILDKDIMPDVYMRRLLQGLEAAGALTPERALEVRAAFGVEQPSVAVRLQDASYQEYQRLSQARQTGHHPTTS